MKTLFLGLVGIFTYFFMPCFIFGQTVLISHIPGGRAQSVDFINDNIGCIGIPGGILRTSNAGLTWTQVFPASLDNHYLIEDISFYGEVGYAVAYHDGTYLILKSENKGLSWFEQYTPSTNVPYGRLFLKNETEFFITSPGASTSGINQIFRSTDGGASLHHIATFHEQSLSGIALDNSGKAYVATNNFWTSKDLFTWTYYTDPLTSCFSVPKIITHNFGYEIFLGGEVYYNNSFYPLIISTIDGGQTWDETILPFEGTCWSIDFSPTNKGYAVATKRFEMHSYIYFKDINTSSWHEIYTSNGLELGSICATDSYVYSVGWHGGQSSGAVMIRLGQTVGTGSIPSLIPREYKFNQNYPNPFNPVTKILFDLPKNELVKLIVYDITGRVITTLVNEVKNAGSYNVIFDGSNFPSGAYFYRLTAGKYDETKKMLLIK